MAISQDVKEMRQWNLVSRQDNMRNSFHIKKCGGEIIPDLFLKNKNSEYIWINSPKFSAVWFCYVSLLSATEIYWNYCVLAFTSYKALQFLVLNPWKVPWNWIALYWNYFFTNKLGLVREETGCIANKVYS